MARFQVVQTINKKSAFVIRGLLLEGIIREGMHIHMSLNKSLQVTGEIDRIVKTTNNYYDIEILCSDSEEIDFWEMLNLKGDIIEIGVIR